MRETLTDVQLVEQLKLENNPEALQELVSRHSGLYFEMVNRYGSGRLTNDQLTDLHNDKEFNFYEAALDYNPEKSKFPTFLALKMKYLCYNMGNKNSKMPLINIDSVESYQPSCFEPFENVGNNEIFSKVIELVNNHKDPRVKEIFNQRYFTNTNHKLKPWKQIAKSMSLSIQGCINIHNRVIEELQNEIFKNEKITS